MKSRISRNKLLSVQNFATKRLMRDLAQIKKEPLAGISALPLENNLFVWHCNILGPKDTPWEGGIFHLVMHFDQNYPNSPPKLTLATRVEHPNVMGNSVCLDMLEKRESTNDANKYEGWSSAYTVQSILVQLQSFLFEAEPSKILKDISNPKDYEKQKKEWLSGVRWSVEQSRNYTDKSVGHFPPRSPWPPLPEDKDIRLSLSGEQLLKDELTCFYTRQSFEEDCLGYGISYSKNLRTGEIKSIQSPLDLVSLRAYMNHKLRLSAHNEKFTHWLPVFIDAKHGEKAMYLAKRSMSIICTGHHASFEPKHVLEILPKLMSTMIVELMSGKRHASLKALRGYCFFHRMFLEFVNQYPELKEMCNKIVKDFIEKEETRHKETGVANLGEFLTIIPVTDYTWSDIREAYMKESFIRNVFWLLNRYPELEQETSQEFTDDDRIQYSFEVAKTSLKLLMFHVFFLENVAKPADKSVQDIIEQYDRNFGRPSAQFEDLFLTTCENINALKDYYDFFNNVGKGAVQRDELLTLLKESIKASKEKGYHGSKASVLSPEQFAKENRPVDLEKLCTENDKGELILEQDEEKWREMCSNRWGLNELPDYLQNTTSQWRKLYLQNNLQDVVSSFNDVPDFQLFHKTVDLSVEIPRLEISMFEPANIKSKYFFLTVLLTKLKNLDTLIIKKGETGLGTNGFKALVKGLANNPGTLKTLILEFCDINAKSIEELTKGKLVSGNLRRLILKGNPLGDQGANHLASFLMQHQNLPHLEELDLSDCKIGYNGANAIAEALLVKKELKVLNMINNQCNQGIQTILQNLSYSPSIQELNVSKVNGTFNDRGSNSLKKLLKLSVSLSKLNLWKLSGVANIAADVFAELEKNTSLKELDMGDTGYNNLQELGKALKKNKNLEVLNLRNNNINCTHTFNMLEELKQGEFSIKELILANNVFQSATKPKHKNTIGEILQLGKFLTFVDLSQSNISKEHMEAIGEALKPQHNLQLKKLILRKNNIGKYGLKPVVEALKVNTVLEELDISGNDIGVLGSQSVASFISSNKSIKRLNLFGNLIEIEGAINIAKALQSNTTLTDIDLGLNRIRARGALAVAELLSTNETIVRIGLKHNHINDKSGMKIATSIVENAKSAINYIALAGNFLSVPCRSEIAVLFNQQSKANKHIVFDLAKLVEVKDAERQERTVYLSPLPMTVTEQQIKKIFYQNKCGVCLNVSIHSHKTRTTFAKAKYAFVEFAHIDSVALAMRLVHMKKNYIGGSEVRIVRAGVQQKNEETKTTKPTPTARHTQSVRGRSTRGRGRR